MAAGVVQTSKSLRDMVIVQLAWTAAANGSVPDHVITDPGFSLDGFSLLAMETIPGADAKAPQAAYDITLTNASGCDLLGGAGEDRSASAAEMVCPLSGTTVIVPPVDGALTFALANNNVNGAEGVARFYFSSRR